MGSVRHERIVSDPEIMTGKPVEELLAAYPHLSREDILAALRYAADWLRLEDIEFGAPAAA